MFAATAAASLIATWFGCGLNSKAPGTVGSLGAIPLHLLLCRLSPGAHIAAVIITTATGIWAAQREALESGQDDPQRVVIDEVAGTLIAMGLVRTRSVSRQLAALVLFRALDIWKPGPIRTAENAKPKGLGIMLDDLVAGLGAGVAARLWP
jgi:phosphatidylglycerophosphatase A